MNWKQAKKEMQRTFDFLDKFDLTEYIKNFNEKPLWDLMQFLEDKIDHEKEFPMYLFNCVNTEEFADYIRSKYKANVEEVLTIFYR
jgi:hypothetical protein